MTLLGFAAEHTFAAVILAGFALAAASLLFALPVTIASLIVTRPVKWSVADRATLTSAAARLRHAALIRGEDGHYDARDAIRAEAKELERMAAR